MVVKYQCIDCDIEINTHNESMDGKRCPACGGRIVPREYVAATRACVEESQATLLLRGLKWKGANNFDSIPSYDKDTETILVDEHGLIQIANPVQRPSKL